MKLFLKYWTMLILKVKKTQEMMKIFHLKNWYPIRMYVFETCMRWMEQQEDTTPQQVMLPQKLKNDASRKRCASLKQLSMTDFMQ